MNFFESVLSTVVLLSVSGAVFAELDNPGFEIEAADSGGDPTLAEGWIQTNAIRTDGTGHDTPNWSLWIEGDDQVGGGASQMYSVEGCSPYGLATFDASGWYNTLSIGSEPTLMLGFMPEGIFSDTDESGAITAGYQEMTISGNIPAFAMMVNFVVEGIGDAQAANIHWDDVSFNTDCVADFAKISGKAGIGSRGRWGSNGEFSFAGAIGTLESEACTSGEPVGWIAINYKTAGYVCTFIPAGEPIDYSDDMATIETTYDCVGEEDLMGTATIILTQGAGGSNKQKMKDRGEIWVEADDDDDAFDDLLDIAEETVIKHGNVILQPADCEDD